MTSWAVIGPGQIARWVLPDLRAARGVEVLSVASRSADRAAQFAAQFSIPRSGTVGDILADADVDVVYIAGPHPSHHPLTLAALDAGKGVLCEKAFAMTAAEAREMAAVARDRGVFLMEAMWLRFNGAVAAALEIVESGSVGEPRYLASRISFVEAYDPNARRWDPAQGGGAIHELGVYPLSLAHFLLGPPDQVRARGRVLADGVDASAEIDLEWAGRASGQLACSLDTHYPGESVIGGTDGALVLGGPTFDPWSVKVVGSDGSEELVEPERRGRGYVPMFEHVAACVQAGATESEVLPLDHSVAVMESVDAVVGSLAQSTLYH